MLHYETIDPGALALLRELQSISQFSQARLVGGTSLALQFGHRKSVDLDLFGELDLEELSLASTLGQFQRVKLLSRSKNIFTYLINGV
jgi:hypothetical protein